MNSVDPDQTAPLGAVRSGSILFAILSASKQYCFTFRVITDVRIFRIFTVLASLAVKASLANSLTLKRNPALKWAATSEFGTYRVCEQRRFRRACASVQSHQNLRCSLIQALSQEEPSDRKPHLWPLSMAGHAQLKFVMTECSKTHIRLTRPK